MISRDALMGHRHHDCLKLVVVSKQSISIAAMGLFGGVPNAMAIRRSSSWGTERGLQAGELLGNESGESAPTAAKSCRQVLLGFAKIRAAIQHQVSIKEPQERLDSADLIESYSVFDCLVI